MKKIRFKTVAIILLCLLGSAVCYGQSQKALSESIPSDSTMGVIPAKVESNRITLKGFEAKMDSVSLSIGHIAKRIESNFKDLSDKISEVETRTQQETKAIISRQSSIETKFGNLSENQEAIKKQLQSNNTTLNNRLDSLRMAQSTLEDHIIDLTQNTGREIVSIKKSVFIKSLAGGLVILFTLLAIIVVVVVFQKKLRKMTAAEESVKLDAKLSEILEKQLILMEKEAMEKEAPRTDEDMDHSLPIRVGAEIFRMRKRISNMDESTKGLSALNNALTRLEDEFNHHGYTLEDLTGKPYVDGLSVKVLNWVQRDDLEPGTEIISRMITPHIFYKGVLVSEGEVEVSFKNSKQSE